MQIANPGHVPSVMISSWIHSCMYYFSSHIRSLIFLGTCTVLICTLWTACLLVRLSYVHWQNRFYSNNEKLVGCTLISCVPVMAVFGILFGAPLAWASFCALCSVLCLLWYYKKCCTTMCQITACGFRMVIYSVVPTVFCFYLLLITGWMAFFYTVVFTGYVVHVPVVIYDILGYCFSYYCVLIRSLCRPSVWWSKVCVYGHDLRGVFFGKIWTLSVCGLRTFLWLLVCVRDIKHFLMGVVFSTGVIRLIFLQQLRKNKIFPLYCKCKKRTWCQNRKKL